MNVIGWVRVSTDEQEESGLGMEAQKAAILRDIESRGWSLFSWFITTASARSKNGKTPPIAVELEKARALCRAGVADGLIAAKMDRFSRYLPLTRELWAEAADLKHGYALVALDNANVDSSTAAGKLQLGMMALFAEYEGDLISERTKAALAVKKAQGVRLGRPRLIPESTRERVRELATGGGGMSYREIARQLSGEGILSPSGKTFGPSTIKKLLA